MSTFRRHWKRWLIGGIAFLLLAFVGGPYIYINYIEGPPPDELSLTAQEGKGGPEVPVDGNWTVSSGSQAGYRVKENLFGQDTTAVGRTEKITGTIAITGTAVTTGSIIVDMTAVGTDKSGRDAQFRDRIMATAQFPTATFTLTKPADFGTVPPVGGKVTVKATGDLTLRGVTKQVVVDLEGVRSADTIQVKTTIPVLFADYNVPNPSIPGISTEDNGVIELLMTLRKAP